MTESNTSQKFSGDSDSGSEEAPVSLWRRIFAIVLPILIITAFVAAAFGIIVATEKPKEEKKRFNTLAVMADYAKREDVQLVVSAQGEARPRVEIDLVPEVGGKIVYVSPNFIEGGIFKKGEVLIRIDDSDYKVAEIRASANVAQAEQVLVREIAEGEIARSDYLELGLQGTPSALALRQPQRQQAEAALQAAKADLENARLQLTRTAVRAPFSGRVRSKQSDIGQFVTPGSRLGRVFSNDIVEVRLPLTDANLSKIDLPVAFFAKSPEEALDVELSAIVSGKRQIWAGKIMRTDSAYDTQSRALFAIAEVFDPYGAGASEDNVPLAPGLFVDAAIKGKMFKDMVVMPRDGLRPDNEVYIIDDKGKAEIRKVNVLDTDSSRAVIISGVAPQELVLLSPMERSRVEMTLKVLDINNPQNVLVEPPKPDWMKKAEADKEADAKADGAADKKKEKKSFFGRKKKEEEKEAESDKPKKPLKKPLKTSDENKNTDNSKGKDEGSKPKTQD